ncbi:hypothetical protein CBR_g55944 [Chara braunii]|uniref:GIY-YIG domain-containing protein n=1 Tax=Chara braunii TaxID=69332 RepID=A0A388MDB2_CHABU|nr:hypothetical protein CBR_g55944 [Chara braunii]|eukprot:GBG92550.1 hypothetical protein CBR_g55944 [Chara braunii]
MERRSTSEEPALRKQIEDMAISLASLKEVFDAEQANKARKEQERMEKERHKQEVKEQLAREEEEHLAQVQREERRRMKKEAEKPKEAEFREGLRKELRMEVRKHVGGACEELHQRLFGDLTKSKGKNKLPVFEGSDDDEDSAEESELEALSEKTGGLKISDKRKRSAERIIGDSPPMETAAKRSTKRGTLVPKRLALSCRHPSMKRSQIKKTPGETIAKLKKIPSTAGNPGKFRYVKENLCVLGGMNVDELKQICRDEDVRFEGDKKKMDTILAITEKRTHLAYGTDKEEEETTEGSTMGIKDDSPNKEKLGIKAFNGELSGVYILTSPTCKAQYVGQTKRTTNTRWKEHLSAYGQARKQTDLYRWWQVFGPESYVLVSIEVCFESELLPLEKLYIRRWSPVLNTTGKQGKGSGTGKRRLGKREQSKENRLVHANWSPRSLPIVPVRARTSEAYNWSVDVHQLLDSQETAERRSFSLMLQRGNVWCGGWRKVKAAFGKTELTIEGLPYPRVIDHVRFRLHELDGINPMICHANYVPKLDHTDREGLLVHEILAGFATWGNRGDVEVRVHKWEVLKCMQRAGSEEDNYVGKYLDVKEVETVKAKLDGLVLTSLDRNAGETVAMCPTLYFEAMMDTFVLSSGYTIMQEKEEDILRRMKADAEEVGLKQFVRWDVKGKFGDAYVLPKHKDLSRFRLVCPTFSEPHVRICRVTAKVLNDLLAGMPRKWHFNLRSVSELVPRLDQVNRSISRVMKSNSEVVAMSFDIKDMFSKLSHEEIIQAVDWVIDHHRSNGREWVRVNTRGKGRTFGASTGDDHWRKMDLETVRNFVKWELEHTYTKATGILLHQVVGIPMGKGTSPPLACMLCAFAEYKFLQSLEGWHRFVFGVRLMDDVSLIVVKGGKKQTPVDRIASSFEGCYPKNLTLQRTDGGDRV